jgi:cobalt/nickel transport protein
MVYPPGGHPAGNGNVDPVFVCGVRLQAPFLIRSRGFRIERDENERFFFRREISMNTLKPETAGGLARFVLAAALSVGALRPAFAHFQMILPSDDMVTPESSKEVTLDVRFWHPFEGLGLPMAKPTRFGVLTGGKKVDLLGSLKPVKLKDVEGQTFDAFKVNYPIKSPGDHVFYVEPVPYWEPSEDHFIVHYTKVVVNALGLEEGWDDEVGMRAEIIPLTRPYGLYTGNVFQGLVKMDGKPMPFTRVEVEYFNQDGTLKAPASPLITQVIKTDPKGVFTYAVPRAGWWGFAALKEDEEHKMKHEGKAYPVEVGAIMWIRARDMK